MASRKEYEMLFQLNAQLGGSYNSTFSKAQQSIVAMQKEIEALSKTQSNISAYQKQQGAVEATRKKLEVLQQQYDNIQKEMGETGEYSSTLENRLLAKQQQIDKTTVSLGQQTQKLDQMGKALNEAGVDTSNLGRETEQLGSKLDELKQKQEEAADKAQSFGTAASQAFGAIQQAIIAAGIAKALQEIYEWFASCADASIEFESAMTGVAKTTDMSNEELAAMSEEIKALSTEIPITTEELAGVAEVAGQLGIAKNDLLDFSEVMSMLATATTMTADEAATMLAQFANITQMDPAYYANLASAIVDLGNNYATTEQKITEMSQGIAASASLAGMSEADMVGLSAAVTSLGIETQAGSTSMSKLIAELMTAVETGENLNEFAAISNMTAADFKTAWGENAVSALQAFVLGLNDTERNGKSATVALTELGITEVRMQRMILSLANSGDLLNNTLATANNAWSENTALTTEAQLRYGTTHSQLVLMQNAYNNLKIAVGDNYTPALQKLYALATSMLKGITEFIQKNPAVVKAITVFVGLIGAVIAALTAYAVVAKVAAAATALLTAAIPGVNIIMGVSVAVAAITAGIVALTSAADDGVPSVKELTEAARAMSDTMDAATATYDEAVTSTLAAANVADNYISKLEEMEAAGINTNEEHRQYHNTLALLCQVVPELAEYIDLETNTIHGGTEALRANTEAWKQNAMQKAYQAQLTSLYESYSAVLIEAEKNSIGLTKAQYELDAANQKYSNTLSRMDTLYAEAAAQAEAWNKEYGGWTDATNFLAQEYYDLQNSIYDVNDEVWAAEQTVKSYNKALEEGAEATAEAEEQIALAEEAVRNLTDATGANSAATAEAAQQEKELFSAIADVTSQVAELAEAYEEAYDAALESIQGQYALWDEADKVVATSAGTINSALESQITYWQEYNANLAGLTDRSADIAGLSDVIASFADGSSDSVNAIAGMAAASDEDLAAMVTNWQALQAEQDNASNSVADLKTDFTATMDELQQELAADIEAMDLGDEAAESGRATIQGFISGAEGMLPVVQTAYTRIAQAAKNALGTTGSSTSIPGYASGTQSAAPGFAVVGEEGPELVYFKGGEQVMSASETAAMQRDYSADIQAVTFYPQLVAALAARGGLSAEPISAMSDSSGSTAIQVVFQIDGPVSDETIARLEAYGEEFAERVREVMEDAGIDAARRAYT